MHLKKNIPNSLPFLNKYFNIIATILVATCATAGSYGIFKLLGYLDSMTTGVGEQITINKHLFSVPIFLLFALVVINLWRKGIPENFTFSKNSIAATIAIYISIFIIGGMVSRTLFAKRAEYLGYSTCPDTNYSNVLATANEPNLVRPTSIVWLPKDRCKKVREGTQPSRP